jgi:uncharacterized membrane protein YdbT with pleckstrin-like domain
MNEYIAIRRHSKKTLKFWLKAIFTLGIYWLFWHRSDYVALTEKSIVRRWGVVQRFERTVPLHRVQDVSIRQGILGRLLNYGELRIETAGGSSTEIAMETMDGPAQFRDLVLQQVEIAEEIDPDLSGGV